MTMINKDNYVESFKSPLGLMEIRANQEAIHSIMFIERDLQARPNDITNVGVSQLQQYFAGERTEFDLPLAPNGTTFQKQVWKALCSIGYGETCSYGEIANAIKNPKAVRAVGAANGKNPLTIVVPCHRIIGRDGSLTGYASGVERKSWLLNHESESLF